MVIQHNMAAENSDRMSRIVLGKLAKSSEKLASGYRINRGADDAAGLAISEKLRFQIRGLGRGSSNIDEGIGYCQVADGALSEMHDMLHRMNELCIQAANGTLSDTDREYVNEEVQNLKAEIDRTCRMTKFNEEYIFRCDDVMPSLSHEVYKMTFSGRPKDLFIYNSSYDAVDEYAGVAFRGRRYSWDEIDPMMYDKTKHEFREGTYSLRADDGTELTLVCEKGAKLPQISRQFMTTADAKGIYVNSDLVSWNQIRQAGDVYTFDYHGMTVSFTKGPKDSWDDMLTKLSGTLWESTYETPVEAYSVDAAFSYGTTYRFVSNKRVETYLKNDYMPKYILHAEDGNNGGRIPVHDANGNFLRFDPFDGVWLEGTNEDGTPNGKVAYEITNGQKKLCAMTWAEFGFDCGDDNGDWGNQSTDIWSGADNITDDPRPPYPADSAPDVNLGTQIFPNYDPYKKFDFYVYNNAVAPPDDREHVSFYFSVINEVSKEQVIKTLDNIVIGYPLITPHDHAEAKSSSNKVTINRNELDLSLSDEYSLGRDYGNNLAKYILKGPHQLNYANGKFSLSYGYDPGRKNGNMVLSGRSDLDLAILKQRIITGGLISVSGNDINLSASNTRQTINVFLSGGDGSSLDLSFNYNISDFFSNNKASVTETQAQDGEYVKINNRYVKYDPWNSSHKNRPRYNVDITGAGGQSLEDYFNNTVYKDIANATTVSLHTDEYPTGSITGEEVQQTAMVTRWKTPFQHNQGEPDSPPVYKPEYLKIQCSSNTIDYITLQKQRLSLYRLGILNVGTLSQMQATGCIDQVGKALDQISSVRSQFGAYQNRLEHAYAINQNTHENTQSAESKIRDTDMADEMVRFSNDNILQQSANAMLAQANQLNQHVLALLS
ncbi:MAG: hypothetical protein HFH75_11825 [Lachnospiraceae bacterium]|jgi:flagellin-like hook-associated protein FlgL|nr:hypothetical protein [Lachnospiraceae bacterium]